MDDAAKDVFAAKVDAFAATLDPEEQTMLIDLLVGDHEVTGFATGWGPGFRSMLDDAGIGNIASVKPEGRFFLDRTDTSLSDFPSFET